MSKLAAFMGSNGGVAAGGAIVVAAAVGAGLYVNSLSQPQESPATPDSAQVATAPAPQTAPQTQPAPEPDTDEAKAPAPVPPRIEDVTISGDGIAVISGKAAPGSDVTVLIDGTPLVETKSDPNGDFAALSEITASDNAQILTVLQRFDGVELASLDEIIIPPTPKPDPQPAVVAQVEPEPEPEPETVAQSQPEPEPEPQPEAVAESDPEPEPQPEAVAEADPEPEPQPEAVAESDPEPEPQPEAVAESDPEPEPQPEAVAESDPEPEPQPEAVAESDPEPIPQPEAVAESDPAPTDAEPQTAAADPAPAPKILRSTQEGVEVLSSTPPEVLENIEIDTISYSQAGGVELAGRAQIDSDKVRVYVDNRALADIDVDAGGRWRGALPQIATGVYTLRVDALDAAGDVTSRVETPFKREDPQVLAAADDPAAPATQITVQTGNTLWGISRERYGDGRLFVQVFQANKDTIRNPDLIFPGQVFALPE